MDAKQQVEDEVEVALQDFFEHLDLTFQGVSWDSHQALEYMSGLNLVDEYRVWIDWSWDYSE